MSKEDNTVEDEPQEDDYIINGNLICQYGRILANLIEWDNIELFIRKHAKANNFFPSVWMLSDHGNYHLVTDFNYDL